MKKRIIRSVWLLVLGFIFLQGSDLVAAAENYKEISVFYKITTKKGVKGYLLGSVHEGLGKTFCKKSKKLLKKYVDESCDFFFESAAAGAYCEFDKSVYGIESIIAYLLQGRQDCKLYSLDTNWKLVEKKGRAFTERSQTYSDDIKQIEDCLKVQKKVLDFVIKNYKKGILADDEKIQNFSSSLKLSEKSRSFMEHRGSEVKDEFALFIEERNEAWIKKLNEHKLDNPFFIIFGAGHLPGKKGMISLLKQEGFVLEPIILWGKK
ncbi:TraB/GumN family protein [Candidatus Babeliales bacterium]|nr:TraB/GumN family protein [Candidatus Babeliales bacterium]